MDNGASDSGGGCWRGVVRGDIPAFGEIGAFKGAADATPAKVGARYRSRTHRWCEHDWARRRQNETGLGHAASEYAKADLNST